MESLGAVQAQDYRGSLWGIGLRTARATEGDVERAIAERSIVRSWPLRGTLHFVASKDIRWMLHLLAPRILARCRARHRQLELDEATFAKSRQQLEKALEGGRSLTRPEAYALLEQAEIATAEQRGIHVLSALAMQGILCFGARRGRQSTFVLLDEWIPKSRALDRDEALGELARRYFRSHGPAQLVDFSWWAGLPLGEARLGLEIAGKDLAKRVAGAREYWSAPSCPPSPYGTVAHLLPPWDEFTVAYRDRDAFLDPAHANRARNGIFSAVVTIDGRIAGLWRRREKDDRVVVEADLFGRHPRAALTSLERAVARYAEFRGLDGWLATSAPS